VDVALGDVPFLNENGSVSMRSRSTPLESFSTFLQFEDDLPRQWATEGRLQRNMQRHLQQLQDDGDDPKSTASKTDRFWALYWHKAWMLQAEKAETPDPTSTKPARNLPLDHLNAYLQETCFWAVNRLRSQFAQTQYSLSDCFQIAILRVPKVLQGFDVRQGFGLTNYASMLFNTTLRDALRQQQEVDICTNWALLRKTSHKRTLEALTKAGLSTEMIAQYGLACQNFRMLYVPQQASGTRKLPPPEPETWRAIVQLYNQQAPDKTDVKTLEQWLNKTAQAIRNYLNPSTVSLNAPRPGQEEGEWQDHLADTERDSLLSGLIQDEELEARLDQRSQLGAVLQGGIDQCDAETRSILPLYYGQGCTQQQISTQLGIKQYTISRRLTRSKEILLKHLATWTRDDLHISLTPDVLQAMGAVLEDWLQTHYQDHHVQDQTHVQDQLQGE
jgi:RNA polymerase sigma factor (sigma-70 family)